MKTQKISALAIITLAALTGCGSTEKAQSPDSTTPLAPTQTPQSSYIELDGAPGLTEDMLEPEDLQAITTARQADAPFYVKNDRVFWLEPEIPHSERVIVEEEAREDFTNHALRSVDGFGTGKLTFYRHEAQPYSIEVNQQ